MGKKKGGHTRLVDDYDDEASWKDLVPTPDELEGQRKTTNADDKSSRRFSASAATGDHKSSKAAAKTRGTLRTTSPGTIHDADDMFYDDEESLCSDEEIEVEFGLPTLTSDGKTRSSKTKLFSGGGQKKTKSAGCKSGAAAAVDVIDDGEEIEVVAKKKGGLCARGRWCRLGCCLIIMVIVAAAVAVPLLLLLGGGGDGNKQVSSANDQESNKGGVAPQDLDIPQQGGVSGGKDNSANDAAGNGAGSTGKDDEAAVNDDRERSDDGNVKAPKEDQNPSVGVDAIESDEDNVDEASSTTATTKAEQQGSAEAGQEKGVEDNKDETDEGASSEKESNEADSESPNTKIKAEQDKDSTVEETDKTDEGASSENKKGDSDKADSESTSATVKAEQEEKDEVNASTAEDQAKDVGSSTTKVDQGKKVTEDNDDGESDDGQATTESQGNDKNIDTDKKNTEKVEPSSATGSEEDKAVDKTTVEDEMNQIFDALSTVSGDAIYADGSPQNKAARFVAVDDPRGPRDMSDPFFLQRYALATLYYSTSGDDWNSCQDGCSLSGDPFLSAAHECLWGAVICHSDGKVASIDFGNDGHGHGLSGDIPPEIGLLDSLMRLNVRNNKITSIPDTLADTQITELVLSSNNIKSFPTTLYGKKSVEKIYIDRNDFEGVPLPNFAAMPKLAHIQAHYNSFTGTIDHNIGNLSKLRNIDLSFNKLTGTVPAELGRLDRLVRLDVASNQLTGELSPDIASMSRLITLSASNNMLTGSIPTHIGFMGSYWAMNGLQRDKVIRLDNNSLEGPIPAELANIQGLTEVALHGSNNLFTGDIPQPVCSLSSLVELTMDCTQLDCSCSDACLCLEDVPLVDASDTTGEANTPAVVSNQEDPVASPVADDKATNINNESDKDDIVTDENEGEKEKELDMEEDDIYGILKAISGSATERYGTPQFEAARWIMLFDPSGVRAGDDPRLVQRYALASFYYSTGMERFLRAADECKWKGITCDDTTRMVTEINFHGQGLNGAINREIGYLRYLKRLDLSNNEITSSIPASLGNTQIKDLLLSNNNIRSPFPTSLYNKESIERIFIDRNLFTGLLPKWATMPNLTYISAFDNMFVGKLDPAMGSLKELRAILLSSNQILGSIPVALSNLKKLEKFEIGNNLMYGSIPPSILGLPRLLSLSLANNQFSGEVDRTIKNMGSAWDGKSKRKYVRLEGNELSGPIPPALANIENLYVLTLHGNNFTGNMPRMICDLKVASSGFSYDLFKLTSDCDEVDCSCSAACKCIDQSSGDPNDWANGL